MWSIFAVLVLISAPTACYQQWRTIYQRITQEPEFSGFNAMIRNNRVARLDLIYAPLTVFVPENDAVDDHDGPFPDNMVLYHMGVEARTLRVLNFNSSMETTYVDSPPLWVTVNEDGYFVNDAKIVEEMSNFVASVKGDATKKQVLHVIDRVLDPLIYTPSHPNPTALTFLSHHYNWKIGSHRVTNFFHKIQLYNKGELYRRGGGHTFFVPIDHKTDDYKWENIDGYVIEGHVVPHMVLFTRPTTKGFYFETAANGDYTNIVVSLEEIGGKVVVKSYTTGGNGYLKKREVTTEIVKANIPVANGVVHLIKQPLAVFDRELKPFPYLSVYYKISADPDLSQTFNIASRTQIIDLVQKESTLYTFFAPRDRAWTNYLNYSREELGKILGRHVVASDGRFSMAKLAQMTRNGGGEVTMLTLEGPIKIQVRHSNDDYHIVWDGRPIRVYRPDYECSNGIVHLIDDVFANVKTSSGANHAVREDNRGFWRVLKNIVM